MNTHAAHDHNVDHQAHHRADWLDDYIQNALLDARNGDINVERDASDVITQIRAGIRDDIINGKGNWLAAHRDTPLAESNSSAPPAFAVSMDALVYFSVDADALASWLRPIHPEDLEFSLPSKDSEYPSRDLSCLVCDAIDNGALIGDPRLRLTVYEGDDDETTGYYAVLHNATGDQRLVGITSGWTELDFADPKATLVDQAREYLTVVCSVANTLLAITSPHDHHLTAADASPRPAEGLHATAHSASERTDHHV